MKTIMVALAVLMASSAWAYDAVEGFQRGMERVDAERRHEESMKVQREMLESQQRQEFNEQIDRNRRTMDSYEQERHNRNEEAMEIMNGGRRE